MVTGDLKNLQQSADFVHTPHFMLVPSLACPADCTYCFGPHRGPVISSETLNASLDFMGSIVAETEQQRIEVTCDLRHLCGGTCRAWDGDAAQSNLNAMPPDCDGLAERSARLLNTASDYLGLREEELPCSRG